MRRRPAAPRLTLESKGIVVLRVVDDTRRILLRRMSEENLI